MRPRPANCLQEIWQVKLNAFLALAKASTSDNPIVWWKNPLNYNSMRLANNSYIVLAKVGWTFYEFKVTESILPKTLLQLEKYILEPYFLQNHKTIHLTSSQDAMMLSLHANNLQQYLNTQST